MAQNPAAVASAVRPNQPARQTVATFDNYADAERTVEYLVDRQFAVNRLGLSAGICSWLSGSPGR